MTCFPAIAPPPDPARRPPAREGVLRSALRKLDRPTGSASRSGSPALLSRIDRGSGSGARRFMTPLQELAGALGIELARPAPGGSWHPCPTKLSSPCVAPSVRTSLGRGCTSKALAASPLDRVGIEPVTVVWDHARRHHALPRRRSHCRPFAVTVDLDTGVSFTWTHEECRVGAVRETDDGTVAVTVWLPRAPARCAVSIASHRRHHVRRCSPRRVVFGARTAAEMGRLRAALRPPRFPLDDGRPRHLGAARRLGGAPRRHDRRHVAAAR